MPIISPKTAKIYGLPPRCPHSTLYSPYFPPRRRRRCSPPRTAAGTPIPERLPGREADPCADHGHPEEHHVGNIALLYVYSQCLNNARLCRSFFGKKSATPTAAASSPKRARPASTTSASGSDNEGEKECKDVARSPVSDEEDSPIKAKSCKRARVLESSSEDEGEAAGKKENEPDNGKKKEEEEEKEAEKVKPKETKKRGRKKKAETAEEEKEKSEEAADTGSAKAKRGKKAAAEKSSPKRSSPKTKVKEEPVKSEPEDKEDEPAPTKSASPKGEKPKKNPFAGFFTAGKSGAEKSAGETSSKTPFDVAVKRSSYDPVSDAIWERGERVPYLAFAKTLQAIESTSGRLKIVEILANYFRSVMALTPDDLLPSVYLCLNRLAPAYEGVELGRN